MNSLKVNRILLFIFIINLYYLGSAFGQLQIFLKRDAPTARMSPVAASVNNKIYLIGGLTADKVLPLVEEYDPLKDQWVMKNQLPNAVAGATCVALNNQIFIIGGRHGNDVLNKTYKYDPSLDIWKELSAMPTSRYYSMSAVVEGKIYVLGGISGTGNKREPLDVIEMYDPNTDKWKTVGKMPAKRSNAAVAVLKNEIYIIGGRLGVGVGPSATSRVDVFDPLKTTWRTISPLNHERTACRAAVIGDRIFVIGGAAKEQRIAALEIYDLKTSKWDIGPNLKIPRTDHACAAIDNKIYVMAGFSKPDISGILKSVEEIAVIE